MEAMESYGSSLAATCIPYGNVPATMLAHADNIFSLQGVRQNAARQSKSSLMQQIHHQNLRRQVMKRALPQTSPTPQNCHQSSRCKVAASSLLSSLMPHSRQQCRWRRWSGGRRLMRRVSIPSTILSALADDSRVQERGRRGVRMW